MKVIIRDNVNKNEINYLVKYKTSLDNYKRYFYIVMNKEEMDYILKNKTEKNGNIEIKKYSFLEENKQ